MEFWENDASWYASNEGVKAYHALQKLEDKTLFLYAYLQKKLHKSFENNNACFKLALFFADAIEGASLPYSGYSEIIDPMKNPYLAYVTNWDKYPGKRVLYYGLMSILHGLADPMLHNSWIYDKALMGSELLQSKLVELERNFYDEGSACMPGPLAYDIEDELSDVQFKLRWFFDKK